MSVDPATAAANAAAMAATAAVQALSEVLQPAALPQHRLSLPAFWTQDLAVWFQHAEAEFTLARLPANSYVCYVHVIRARSSEVLTAVRDLTRDITAATPQPYLLLKDALLSRFTASPLQQCFRILDMPPLGDRRPSALFAELQSLLPRDANVLFNAIFLHCLPERMRLALVNKCELLPVDLAAASDLLQHSNAASIVAAQPTASSAPVNAVYTPPRRPQSCSPPPSNLTSSPFPHPTL
jgi:hypothetical protein